MMTEADKKLVEEVALKLRMLGLCHAISHSEQCATALLPLFARQVEARELAAAKAAVGQILAAIGEPEEWGDDLQSVIADLRGDICSLDPAAIVRAFPTPPTAVS